MIKNPASKISGGRTGGQNWSCLGVGASGVWEEDIKKGCRRVNTVKILGTHV
jgi:hypothetical protein